MRTFKFLARGARGPFSGYTWPSPGIWISTEGPLVLGSCGIHVCRAADLAHWLHDELWEAETAGAILDGKDCIVSERARLVRHVDAWNADGAARFATACIEHVEGGHEGFVDDARNALAYGYPALSAYASALATTDFRRERAWQSSWLEREFLALS